MPHPPIRAEFTARYFVESSVASEKAAQVIAGEQSSGTFLSLPGETDALKERSRARVVRDQAKHEGGRLLGRRLGEVVDAVLRAVPLRRMVLSGGDTSSQITQRLAPDALLIAARLAPGAPLCCVLSREPHLSGLQIALKGGQMGQADYFVVALRGRSPASSICIL